MNHRSGRAARLFLGAASAGGVAALRALRALLALLALPALLALVACGSAPPVAPPAVRVETVVAPELPVPVAVPVPVWVPRQSTFERSQRDRAIAFLQQRRLAEAAIAWEILALLRPDVEVYRERLLETQRQIDARVAERLPQAALSLQRGQIDEAFQQYLAVLALQPNNLAAADALRALERDRNARQHLGKLSRNTITRSAMVQSETSATVRRAAAAGIGVGAGLGTEISADAGTEGGIEASAGSGIRIANRIASRIGTANEVEHAALLAGDGELDEAIRLLEDRVAVERRDAAARRLLASLYYRKAEALAVADRQAAIVALRKSERLDPTEPRTAVLLKKLGRSAGALGAAPAAHTAAPKRPGDLGDSRSAR